MWFQAAECKVVNASLLLNLINNNFLIFLTENLPILNPSLLQKSENLRPHSSKSIENATPSSSTSPLASCKGVTRPGIVLQQIQGNFEWDTRMLIIGII